MNFEDVRAYLPKYLSPATEERLFKDLVMFPDNIDSRMYTHLGKSVVYQGDVLTDLTIVRLPECSTKNRPGMVLSNTCDLDGNNARLQQIRVLYAPVVSLTKYRELLKKHGVVEEKTRTHITNIRKQRITQIFYLPTGPSISESIVFFDSVVSNRPSALPSPVGAHRLVSLSQYGFYLLLYKMSIHFTRLAEGVDRGL